MKKYIKASDGSFLSFEKKAKRTFKPVTAASRHKRVQSSKNISATNTYTLYGHDADGEYVDEITVNSKSKISDGVKQLFANPEIYEVGVYNDLYPNDCIDVFTGVQSSKNISASYDEYDEDVNLPGKIRHQIAELTGWREDDIAFAFQQWIYDGGGEYDLDEMPKRFRDDIASDVERGEDIEAKYLNA